MTGAPELTMVRGNVIVENGEIVAEPESDSSSKRAVSASRWRSFGAWKRANLTASAEGGG